MGNGKRRKKFKIKHKIGFVLCILGYLASVLFGDILLMPSFLGLFGTIVFGVVAIWMTNLNDEQVTKWAFISICFDTLLYFFFFIVMDEDPLFTLVVVVGSLLFIVGLPVLIILLYAKKHNVGSGEPLVKVEIPLDPQILAKERKKCMRRAGLTYYMAGLTQLSSYFLIGAIPCFVLTAFAFDQLWPKKSNLSDFALWYLWPMLGGLLVFCLAILLMVIFFKLLQVRCYKNGFFLSGEDEVEDRARSLNFQANLIRTMGGIGAFGTSSLVRSIAYSSYSYLEENGKSAISFGLFQILSWALLGIQLLIGCGAVVLGIIL